MDIILLQNIDKVGSKHTVVTVKDGFARNFLIPKGMAVIANKSNMKQLDSLRAKEDAVEAEAKAKAEIIAAQLATAVLKIGAKVGETGKIFGSVTNVQIAKAIADAHNIEIERKYIELEDEVKTIGVYHATVTLHKDVVTKVEFEVVEE